MSYFELGRHDEPSMVNFIRWRNAGREGLPPRRKLTYPYLQVRIYMPWKKNDDESPELIRMRDPHWEMVRTKAPNAYVKAMREQRFLVYRIDLTILRDYTKLDRDPNYVAQYRFPYRVSLMLEMYSYWKWNERNGQANGLNPDPPHFEVILDWITKHINGGWSFAVEVTPNWENCAFEYSFETKADANAFVLKWK